MCLCVSLCVCVRVCTLCPLSHSKVIVMSATIHAAPFVNFFGGPKEANELYVSEKRCKKAVSSIPCCVLGQVHLLKVPGRQHAVPPRSIGHASLPPSFDHRSLRVDMGSYLGTALWALLTGALVWDPCPLGLQEFDRRSYELRQVYYTPSPEPDILEAVKGHWRPVAQGHVVYAKAAMLAVLQLHVTRPPGDVLVFLPGPLPQAFTAHSLGRYRGPARRTLTACSGFLRKSRMMEGQRACLTRAHCGSIV